MNTLYRLFVCSTLALACPTANADVSTIAGPIVCPVNGHSYYLLSSSTWTEAEAFAQTLGGHLATINDRDEDLWIFNTFPALTGVSQPDLWIGLNDAEVEGTWVWASGEAATNTFWAVGEPNNTPNADPTGEDYAAIRPPGYLPDGSWNDLPTDGGGQIGKVFGVVEVAPKPHTFTPLMMGLCAALALGAAVALGAALALRNRKKLGS
jgi:hypothetical protein